jgi:hypothetical protein
MATQLRLLDPDLVTAPADAGDDLPAVRSAPARRGSALAAEAPRPAGAATVVRAAARTSRRPSAGPGPALAPTPADWKLDEHTRAVGRRGVEAARLALAAAVARSTAA